MPNDHEIKVFFSNRESTCQDCKKTIQRSEKITLKNHEPTCMECSDLDHLIFLPSGNAALTVRSKKYSNLYAVVLKWSSSRKRNERQGLLVEKEALEKAEQECLSDEELRNRQKENRRARDKIQDKQYVKDFAAEIINLYPNCPKDTAVQIAQHACEKYSGRVGRSADAKKFDPSMITLAVRAHIRHVETEYDELLMKGWDRYVARESVNDKIDGVLSCWGS
jgi:hypothetical protein